MPEIKKYYFDDDNKANLCNIHHYNDNSKLHREDGPAIINYNSNGNILDEIYFINGLEHRSDGPAVIQYYTADEHKNKIKREVYYKNGLCHREDGPAEICYNISGKILISKYFFNSYSVGLTSEITQEEFLQYIKTRIIE